MTRLFVAPEAFRDGRVTVRSADLSHIKNVLRMRPGEQLSVSDGSGRVSLCRILSYEKDEAVLEILEDLPSHELSSRLVLFQGLPKGDKLETIIQKAVELGAAAVVPVAMKRSIAKWDVKKAEAKLTRYRAIAKAAAEQSGRDVIPEVLQCVSLSEALKEAKALDHILMPYELQEGIEGSRETVRAIRPGESVGILIGPEGGFAPEEAEEILAAGGKAVTLGKRILRTETAGMAMLSVLTFLLEEDTRSN